MFLGGNATIATSFFMMEQVVLSVVSDDSWFLLTIIQTEGFHCALVVVLQYG